MSTSTVVDLPREQAIADRDKKFDAWSAAEDVAEGLDDGYMELSSYAREHAKACGYVGENDHVDLSDMTDEMRQAYLTADSKWEEYIAADKVLFSISPEDASNEYYYE